MLIFGNTQSILAEAQRNRDQLLAASPQEKLRLLSETRATSDNQQLSAKKWQKQMQQAQLIMLCIRSHGYE